MYSNGGVKILNIHTGAGVSATFKNISLTAVSTLDVSGVVRGIVVSGMQASQKIQDVLDNHSLGDINVKAGGSFLLGDSISSTSSINIETDVSQKFLQNLLSRQLLITDRVFLPLKMAYH